MYIMYMYNVYDSVYNNVYDDVYNNVSLLLCIIKECNSL